MFGTRPDIDRVPMGNAPKTYQFAEKLHGRFFVSGVSGSFRKHAEKLIREHQQSNEKFTFKPVAPKFEEKFNSEYQKDAQRLVELENRLSEIQRKRNLRNNRDIQRRQGRRQYTAAVTIQRAIRRYFYKKKTQASDIMQSFLKMVLARQAVSAAYWAAAIIRRFAKRVCYFLHFFLFFFWALLDNLFIGFCPLAGMAFVPTEEEDGQESFTFCVAIRERY